MEYSYYWIKIMQTLFKTISLFSLSVKPPSPTDDCSPREDDFRYKLIKSAFDVKEFDDYNILCIISKLYYFSVT